MIYVLHCSTRRSLTTGGGVEVAGAAGFAFGGLAASVVLNLADFTALFRERNCLACRIISRARDVNKNRH